MARHSFGCIVHNGSAFVAEAVRSVYDFASEVVIVEGCDRFNAFAASRDGLSLDGTRDAILSIPDPSKKIVYVPRGFVEDKVDQANEYMRRVTGDYVWELDSDELYKTKDLVLVGQLMENEGYEAAEIPFLHFWRGVDRLAVGGCWQDPIRRVFARQSGDVYGSHRPPGLARKPWSAMRVLTADKLRELGVFCYHFGFVDNQTTKWKMAYHTNRGRNLRNHFVNNWIGDTAQHVNDKPGVNRLQAFEGVLPETLSARWTSTKKCRVLHVLPSWSERGGCTAVRHLIEASNLGYFSHGVYVEGYKGRTSLPPSVPLHTSDFKTVAAGYDVLEFTFWMGLPSLTQAVSMRPKPRIVILLPIYNSEKLNKGRYDRFFLTREEKEAADAVVFVTEKGMILPENDGIPKGRMHYIPSGPELIWAALDGYNRKKPAGAPHTIGYVGPCDHVSTDPRLPEILGSIASASGRKTLIQVVGGGNHVFKSFVNRTRRDKRFEWHDFRLDVVSMMKDWDLYVYPMPTECTNACEMKLQEATASSVPLVIRPSVGLADMGFNGSAVVCDSEESLISRSVELLANNSLRHEVGDAGRENALRQLGSHTAARRMEQLYLSLM